MRSGGIFGGPNALGLGEVSGFLCTPGLDPYYCKCMQESVGPVEPAAAPAAIAKWMPYCQQEAAKNKTLGKVITGMFGVSKKEPEPKKEPVVVGYTGGVGSGSKTVVVGYTGGGGTKMRSPTTAVSAPTTNWILLGGVAAAALAIGVLISRK